MTEGRPPSDILKLNAWMKEYAAAVNATYVDYFSAMVDDKGWLNDGISGDGLHPNADGYAITTRVLTAALQRWCRRCAVSLRSGRRRESAIRTRCALSAAGR